MEGITNIEKTEEEITRCQKIVQEEITIEIAEEVMKELTKDIMNTAVCMGGDFSNDNIRNIAKQYQEMKGVERFLKVYKEEQ